MADCYEHMSIAIPLRKNGDKRKRAWWEKVSEALQSVFDDDSEYQAFLRKLLPEEARDCAVCAVDVHEDLVLITDDDGSLQTDGIAAIFMEYLRKFDAKGHVRIEIAYTCSKPRPGGFGGCAMVVTAKEARWVSTHDSVNALSCALGLDPEDQRNRR